MQIKAADDKRPDIDRLEALSARPDIDPPTRRRIETEIRTLSAGIKGERDAAYEIEFYFGASRNWMTIHDLRLEHEGRVAQIDHLIINRVLQIWVCESKHYSDSVEINSQGEWTRTYRGQRYGVDSPIEQNGKHVDVLDKVLRSGAVTLPHRVVTMRPELRNLILISNNAVIKRPRGKATDIEPVIKAERLKTEVFDTFDDRIHTMVARLVSSETIEKLAQDLVALHRPIAVDWASRFGVGSARGNADAPPSAEKRRGAPDDPSGRACGNCGCPTTFAEVAFCRYNSRRFRGGTYCRACQAIVTAEWSLS